MNEKLEAKVRRRDLLCAVVASAVVVGAAAAATSSVALEPAEAEPTNSADKRKARYHANSAEVQDFYRVNRYLGH